MFGKILLGKTVRDNAQQDYVHTMTPVSLPAHPFTIRLCTYWDNCRANGGMRMGRDIPNRAIAPLLKHVSVAEPVGDWADARLRLAGSGMATHFGHDPSGHLMSDLFGPDKDHLNMLLAGARLSLAANMPGIVDHKVMLNGLVAMRNEMVVLPVLPPEGDDKFWALVGTFAF